MSDVQPDEHPVTESALETFDEATLEDFATLAANEMLRRLKEEPKDIPHHALFKLLSDVNKILERRANREGDRAEEPEALLDILEHPGLSPERRRELLRAALVQVERDRELILSSLEAEDDQDVRE